MPLVTVNIQAAGYEPSNRMIEDVTFHINSGELIGLIGANGAGKSSTIKSMLGLIPFMEGNIEREEGTVTAYLPERPVFYDELTLQEHIDFIAAVEEIPDSVLSEHVQPLLQMFQMEKHIHEIPATYSKGMQQKAMIILTLMKNPDVLIIDEPFIGLDPVATKLLLQLIERERERNVGILMSTHVLDKAEKICDRYLLMKDGHLIASGTLDDFRNMCGKTSASLFDCYLHIAEGDRDE